MDNLGKLENIALIHTHVGGEYAKLKDSYTGLTREGIDALNETEKGIFSDCFLLHARNLINFLCQDKENDRREDDVLALDFVESGKPITTIEKLMPKIEGKKPNYLYVRINKQLSHITKSRKDNIDFFGDKELYKEIFINLRFRLLLQQGH